MFLQGKMRLFMYEQDAFVQSGIDFLHLNLKEFNAPACIQRLFEIIQNFHCYLIYFSGVFDHLLELIGSSYFMMLFLYLRPMKKMYYRYVCRQFLINWRGGNYVIVCSSPRKYKASKP